MMLLINAAVAGHLALAGPQTIAANDARTACRADYEALCSGTQPGGGRVQACLKKNDSKLSSGCRAALSNRS